ncbi:MAG TPA: hypothetical protein VNP96_11185 [Solirubrobacterales bacterium]|nr:hypothetical protein [Solirubrobacterales bacterium]
MGSVFKTIGLTVIAALAMNAVAVVAAHAQGTYTADEYPATVTGEQVGTDVWTSSAGTLSCTHVTYHGELSGPSSSLEVTPTFTGCKAFGLFNATVDKNGCKYKFRNLVAEAPGKYISVVDLDCPPGSFLTVTTSVCRKTYPSQQGLAVETSTFTGIPYRIHRSTQITSISYMIDPGCATASAGNYSNGSLNSSATLSATNELEEPIGISITE